MNIITITTNELGSVARVRAIEPGEVQFSWVNAVTATNVDKFTATVDLPGSGIEEIGEHTTWGRPKSMVEVELPLPVTIKGSANRKARETAAVEAAAGGKAGDPVPAGPVLDAINKKIAERVARFNEQFQRRVDDLSAKAQSLWPKSEFPAERAKVDALIDASRALNAQLSVAKDALHAAGRAKFVEALRQMNVGDIVDLDKVAKAQRQADLFFD